MAQVVSETQADLPPVQKYMQAMAVCNSLALLASQSAMLVFVQRLTVLKKLQTCWTKGSEAQIVLPDDFEPDLEGEVVGVDSANDEVDVKLEPDFARTVDQRLPLLENGESSDDTIVDEPLACSVVLCDDIDAVKAEMEVVEEEKPPVKKTSLKIGQRTKVKVQENEDVKAMPKRKRGRPVKPKKATETKEPAEKRSRCEAKEEAVEDPKSSTFRFLCIICKEAFATFVQLKEHKSEAHGPNSNATNHISSDPPLEPNRKRHYCTMCTRSYLTSHKLRTHMFTHTGERPHLCHVCGKGCTAKAILKIHMRTHTGERPHKCLECGASFGQFTDLLYHQRARHTGEKPCVCTVCGWQCRKSSLLIYHMRTHTGEKPIECPFCDRRFSRPSSLSRHKEMHLEIRAFMCPDCGKSFQTQQYLERHKRIHLPVKPYICSECQKGFTQLQNLRTHMRTHTGQKPFACARCEKRFAYQGMLKKHLKSHTEPVAPIPPKPMMHIA